MEVWKVTLPQYFCYAIYSLSRQLWRILVGTLTTAEMYSFMILSVLASARGSEYLDLERYPEKYILNYVGEDDIVRGVFQSEGLGGEYTIRDTLPFNGSHSGWRQSHCWGTSTGIRMDSGQCLRTWGWILGSCSKIFWGPVCPPQHCLG